MPDDQRAGGLDQDLLRRIARDAPFVAPREPRVNVYAECRHPDPQGMIRQLAEAMGMDLPAIPATPEQVWETLLCEVERRFPVRRREDRRMTQRDGVFREDGLWVAYVNWAIVASGPDKAIVLAAYEFHSKPDEQTVTFDGE